MKRFSAMGVLNVTPDSFSDGGVHYSKEKFAAGLENLIMHNCAWADVGAESTSQTSVRIDAKEEWRRYEDIVLPFLKKGFWPTKLNLSIDTFRPEVFAMIYHLWDSEKFCGKLLWNDISGAWDKDLLKEFPKAQYLYVLRPAGHHRMNAGNSKAPIDRNGEIDGLADNIVERISSFYHQLDPKIQKQIWFDSGITFNRTPDQGREIIMQMQKILETLRGKGIDAPWLMGISRKTCLRDPIPPNNHSPELHKEQYLRAEMMHFAWLLRWYQNLNQENVVMRIHDPRLMSWVEKFNTWFPSSIN